MISFEKAVCLEGFLKKKSPSKLKGYQKRYFAIKDSGKHLAYFNQRPKQGTTPSGVIPIQGIEEIQEVDDNHFNVVFSNRTFQLKAENPDTKSMWIQALNLLMEHTESSPDSSPTRRPNKLKSWKPKFTDSNVLNLIRSQSDLGSPAVANFQPANEEQQIMNSKGIWPYICDFPHKVIQNKVTCGFLNKRSRKVKYFQRRWFILIKGTGSEEDSDEIPEKSLPPWMYINHIYYFSYKGPEDDSEHHGYIPTRISSIRIKDMSKSRDSGHAFYLDVGTRIYQLNADTKEEMDKWVEAIQKSKEHAQGVVSSITGNPKAIQKLEELFDNHGASSLKGKVTEEFKEAAKQLEGAKEVSKALEVAETLTQGLLSVVDGCMASKPQRVDVAECYTKAFHKKLCEMLSRTWNLLGTSMAQTQLLELIKWLISYDANLNEIGVVDQKIQNSVDFLILVYCNRGFSNSTQSLSSVMNSVREGKPILDKDSDCYVVCYSEICSIVEPYLFKVQEVSTKSFALNVINLLKDTVTQFEYSIYELINSEALLELSFLIGLCNDSCLLIERSKNWFALLKPYVDSELLLQNLDLKEFSTTISDLGLRVKNYLTETLLIKVDQSFQRPFHELHMEVILKEVVEEFGKYEEHLHKKFARHIWRSLLEEICAKYVTCIFRNRQALKSQSVLLLTETLRSDVSMLQTHFAKKFDSELLEQEIKALQEINEFLEALPSQMKEAVKNLKATHGKFFDFEVAVSTT